MDKRDKLVAIGQQVAKWREELGSPTESKHTPMRKRGIAPWRKVVDRKFLGVGRLDVLECGHEVNGFGSWMGKRRRCAECRTAAAEKKD